MMQPTPSEEHGTLICAKFCAGTGGSFLGVSAIIMVLYLSTGFMGIFLKFMLVFFGIGFICLVIGTVMYQPEPTGEVKRTDDETQGVPLVVGCNPGQGVGMYAQGGAVPASSPHVCPFASAQSGEYPAGPSEPGLQQGGPPWSNPQQSAAPEWPTEAPPSYESLGFASG